MKKASRLINYRPLFYGFIAIALGIFFARHFLLGNTLIIVAVSCAFFALAVILTFTKHLKRLLATLVAFAIGIGVFALSSYNFNAGYQSGTYCVSGRVSMVADYSLAQSVVLDNVYLNGEKINKNIKVFVQNSNTLEVGYVITFTEYLEKTTLFTLGSFNNYEYKYGIAMSATVQDSHVTIDRFAGLSVSESLRNSVKLALETNLSDQEASVCYASLFGDKSLINGEIANNFSISGIAHLLAISGLHIGFVATLISALLKKIPYGRYIRPVVIGGVLLFYCYLCSFSVSCIRATIMAIMMCLSEIFGGHYDKLNSLAVAGLAILLFKPLSVFDAGFLLSFFCVLSITMFVPMISRLFNKIKMPQWLSNALTIVISVQLGLLPLTIYYYQQASLLSILTNLLCVPVFEVFFILLFILSPLVCLIPALGFLLFIPGKIISGIMLIAEVVAKQHWAIINFVLIPTFVIVALYVVMFIMSHFINLKFKQKVCYGLILVFISCIVAFGINLPINQKLNISVLNSYGNSEYVLEFSGAKYYVGNLETTSRLTAKKYFSSVVRSSADGLFFLGEPTYYESEVYKEAYHATINEDEGCLQFNQNYNLKNITVTAKSIDGTLCGYLFNYNNFKVFVCSDFANYYHLASVIGDESGIDVLICNDFAEQDLSNINARYIVVDGKTIISNSYHTINMSGNWTIDFNNSKMSLRSLD